MARWIGDQSKEALRRRDADGEGALTCAYCGVELAVRAHNTNPAAASLDHLTPRAAGGALTDPANLVCCCARCNSRRQDTPLVDWLASLPDGIEASARIIARLNRNADWARYRAEAHALGLRDYGKPKKGVKP
jgi:hypothetical protein